MAGEHFGNICRTVIFPVTAVTVIMEVHAAGAEEMITMSSMESTVGIAGSVGAEIKRRLPCG
jgi:hypothetical protein